MLLGSIQHETKRRADPPESTKLLKDVQLRAEGSSLEKEKQLFDWVPWSERSTVLPVTGDMRRASSSSSSVRNGERGQGKKKRNSAQSTARTKVDPERERVTIIVAAAGTRAVLTVKPCESGIFWVQVCVCGWLSFVGVSARPLSCTSNRISRREASETQPTPKEKSHSSWAPAALY